MPTGIFNLMNIMVKLKGNYMSRCATPFRLALYKIKNFIGCWATGPSNWPQTGRPDY